MYADFERALHAAISQGAISGAAALTTHRDGQTYTHAAGVRKQGETASMSPDTRFWIASMTKAVVSVAALQLVEQRALDLDGDLGTHLPELARPKVLEGFDQDGRPRLRPARGVMTLRRLLTHTSGLAYPFTSAELGAYLSAAGAPDPASGTRAALDIPLLFDPGEGFVYGVGIDWAGLAVEAVSGQRLDAYLRDHVLRPLGMTDTGFEIAPDQAGRHAAVHAQTPAGLAAIPFALPRNPDVLSGGGGLYSTVQDYGRFMRMLLNGGTLQGARILSPETVTSLTQTHTGPHRVGWVSANPQFSRDFHPFPDAVAGHGLAAMVTPNARTAGRTPGSLAWAGIANCYYWVDTDAGVAGTLMTQLLPFADPGVLGLFEALERAAYGKG